MAPTYTPFRYSRLADIIEETASETSDFHDSHIRRKSRRRKQIELFLAFVVGIVLVCIAATYFMPVPRLGPPKKANVPIQDVGVASYRKVVGLVFYGRRDRVSILDCYLKRNLVENGGMLDEVQFVVRTDDVADLDYLDSLVDTTPSYSRVNLTQPGEKSAGHVNYGRIWDFVEPGVMYIKIDDDVVYIANDTIPLLIESKRSHPHHLATSANIINNPALAYIHHHLGAIKPFLPDLSPNSNTTTYPPWRPSTLPPWTGPASFSLPLHPAPPPHSSHPQRWLPLPTPYTLAGTPITQLTTASPFSPAWSNWAIAAQEHYSFLSHLESSTLSTYHFNTWNYHQARLSINMLAILGDDIVANRPVPADDEEWLTVELSSKLGRDVVVEGRALAVHFAFAPQREGLEGTDLLERYRGVVREEGCLAFAPR